MSLGLPSFSMIFSGKAVSAIERSARGIVAMILTDGTEGGKDLNIYKKVDEVDFQNWTEQNYNYLKLVFAGAPSTVITIRRAENAEGYNAELKKLKDLKWNYLTIPGLGSTDTTTISAWIKQYRDDERKDNWEAESIRGEDFFSDSKAEGCHSKWNIFYQWQT